MRRDPRASLIMLAASLVVLAAVSERWSRAIGVEHRHGLVGLAVLYALLFAAVIAKLRRDRR